ncbi:MAG: rhomboid family intramembrane serine protease [Deltaproteobacteria bacterium]|nr:rhomboid family intramembrane serine protease [Deltaproteobacteria bacterium]
MSVPTAPNLPPALQQLRLRAGPLVFAWMAAIAAIHLLFLLAVGLLHSGAALQVYDDWLALSPGNLLQGRVWTLATYVLLHDLRDIWHIVGNLLGLWFFGPAAVRGLGQRRTLRMLVAAAVVGGLLQVGWQFVAGRNAPIVGSSAAVLALLATFAWQQPDAEIRLFFAIPVRSRYLVPIVLGLDLLMVLSGSPIALAAHLGGVAVAWWMVRAGGNWRVAQAHLLALLGGKSRKGARFQVIDGGKRPDRPNKWDVN